MMQTRRFVNFREVCTGGIAPKRLFRSSHPVTCSETDLILAKLAGETEIAVVLNLADNDAELEIKAERISWYHCLFKKRHIIALDMNFDYLSGQFSVKLQKGLKFMLERNGPYLVHCNAGIDRTGFTVMLLEMLMGADKDEIANDYLMSFPDFEKGFRYYKNRKKYVYKVLNAIYTIGETSKICTLAEAAENYLSGKIGLTPDDIHLLKLALS
jgi:protein tyrosine/serine phosphatase